MRHFVVNILMKMDGGSNVSMSWNFSSSSASEAGRES